MYISCVEEIAYRNDWLTKEDLQKLSGIYKTDYGEYLKFIAEAF